MDRPSKANITQFVEVCFNICKEATFVVECNLCKVAE